MPEKAFPQTQSGMIEALEFITEELSGRPVELRDRVVLVAGEVLANAVEHGGDDPEQCLQVETHWRDFQLDLVIVESSDGMDLDQLRQSELPDDRLSESGRGLFLIRTLADDIEPLVGRGGFKYMFRSREEL